MVFSGAVVLIVLVYLGMAATATPAQKDGMDLARAGRIPILDHGRVKPLDTLARTTLMVISGGKQTFKGEDGKTHSAMEWLLDAMTAPERDKSSWASAKVLAYRIESPTLQRLLGLESREDPLYNLEDLQRTKGGLDKLDAEARKLVRLLPAHRAADFPTHDVILVVGRAAFVAPAERSENDRALLDLWAQYHTHTLHAAYETPHKVFRITNDQVLALLGLKARPEDSYRYTFAEIVPRLHQLRQAASHASKLDAKNMQVHDAQVLEVYKHVTLYEAVAEGDADTLLLVAPPAEGGDWMTLPQVRSLKAKAKEDGRATEFENTTPARFLGVLKAYADGKADAFNKAVNGYTGLVQKSQPGSVALVDTEAGFNEFAPFYQCLVLYVVVFLLACVSWVWRESAISWSAFGLGVLVLLVHTWALGERMYIQGRPPVTNLYSSAIFIGWICVCIGLIVEAIFRNGLAVAVGGFLGFCTLLIGDHLGLSGDTLEMMQAVLDTNFWLATHVTCVTIGYASTFVAGAFGMAYIVAGVVTAIGRKSDPNFNLLDHTLSKILGQITYGVVCFAMLFSFVGTILGGLWADYSWGRFWGWDPKENGALLIVIMNALILHARWGGMVKQRGVAVLAVAGTLVTMWSWFGTNQLGIGLHAYGFNNSLVKLCRYYWLSQLVVVGIGMLPLGVWNPPPQVAPKREPIAATPPQARRKGRRRGSVQVQPEFG
jgi:ABC-type transport system involved in cytochrome c biogenesis permease subunit